MKTYARLENHVVAEVINTTGDIAKLFHPSLVWVEVTGKGIQVGWVQNTDGTFAPSPSPAVTTVPPPSVAELLTELTAMRAQVAQLHAG